MRPMDPSERVPDNRLKRRKNAVCPPGVTAMFSGVIFQWKTVLMRLASASRVDGLPRGGS